MRRSRSFVDDVRPMMTGPLGYTVGITMVVLVALAAWKSKGTSPLAEVNNTSLGLAEHFKFEPRPNVFIGSEELHDKHVAEIHELHKAGGVDAVFYGDSILETFEAQQCGAACQPHDRCAGGVEAWEKHFTGLRTHILAVCGDTTHNLLHRLLHGEGPESLKPKVIVLLVGTNDLHADVVQHTSEKAVETSERLVEIARHLQTAAPRAHLVLVGLLPRGDRGTEAPAVKYLYPSKFTAGIDTINERLSLFARESRGQASYINCATSFLQENERVEGGMKINKGLMPDTVHPQGPGIELLAECLAAGVKPHLVAAKEE